MNIAVIGTVGVANFPPGLNLIAALLDLGVSVTLVSNSVNEVPQRITSNPAFSAVELGSRKTKKDKALRSLDEARLIRKYLNEHERKLDAVWTLTDFTARAAGRKLLCFKHIMSISELVEYTPAFFRRPMPFHSKTVVELARNAARVVVPEYNRAHIQKTWWNLPKVPAVLPNKPYPDNGSAIPALEPRLQEVFEKEPRKILLYQGIYAKDRNLEGYAAALDFLGEDYALYLMGRPTAGSGAEVERICSRYANVHNLGFTPAPGHLAATKYGYIGLLPYVARRYGANSALNPLYCAPNKIWEYAKFGLPMLGSDVPGLTTLFQRYGMGEVSDGSAKGIANAVKAIETDYDVYKKRSSSFYASVDVKATVSSILQEAGL